MDNLVEYCSQILNLVWFGYHCIKTVFPEIGQDRVGGIAA